MAGFKKSGAPPDRKAVNISATFDKSEVLWYILRSYLPLDPSAQPSVFESNMTNPNLAPGLPEFSLKNRVVLVSGAARGLGLTQAEALLEAGAIGASRLDWS